MLTNSNADNNLSTWSDPSSLHTCPLSFSSKIGEKKLSVQVTDNPVETRSPPPISQHSNTKTAYLKRLAKKLAVFLFWKLFKFWSLDVLHNLFWQAPPSATPHTLPRSVGIESGPCPLIIHPTSCVNQLSLRIFFTDDCKWYTSYIYYIYIIIKWGIMCPGTKIRIEYISNWNEYDFFSKIFSYEH